MAVVTAAARIRQDARTKAVGVLPAQVEAGSEGFG